MENFEQYLSKYRQIGASEFTIKCFKSGDKATFYIYPVGVEGETLLAQAVGSEIHIHYYLPKGFRIVQDDPSNIVQEENDSNAQDNPQPGGL